jgi:23S rRNA (cytidine1920-2'-O)/16S rRNA (cytidine1409-2'-O)-methyltransferase
MNLLEYLQRSGIPAEERVLRGLILRGDVLVNNQPQTSASFEVPAGAAIRIRGELNRPVSRGYRKISPILAHCGIRVRDRICADLGSSTGGFTQRLLELDARKVYAVDVGYGLLATEIRNNPRVVVKERTNARLLTSSEIPDQLELVVGDLSFISWRAVLPAVCKLLTAQAELLLLIKPQFELSAAGLLDPSSGGIVQSSDELLVCFDQLSDLWQACELSPRNILPAALRGAQGNQEFFIHLQRQTAPWSSEVYLEMIQTALDGVLC